MKHILFGGDGLLGRHLAARLVKDGEEVVVCDIAKSSLPHYTHCSFLKLDVTDAAQFMPLDIKPDDVVYNLLSSTQPAPKTRTRRRDACWSINYRGTVNIIDKMAGCEATRLIHFSSDRIYRRGISHPRTENAPVKPLGDFGLSSWKTEELAADWRDRGMKISVFRPRQLIGPGFSGPMSRLFRLIDHNLPVPMIGSGRNPYQFVSVFDCVEAARLAWKTGVPNEAYNLGSDNPPPVRKLLGNLIQHAGSRSTLLPTPAWAIKRMLDLIDLVNLPVMAPEHYLTADEVCVLDCSKTKQQLGWSADHRDEDMLISAYNTYRTERAANGSRSPAASKPSPTT